MEAQKNICNLLDAGNVDAAKISTNKLIEEQSNNKDLPEALYWTMRHCEWTSQYDEAKRLCQLLIQKYPDNPLTDKAQLSIARSNVMSLVMSGDYDLARMNYDKLIGDFSNHPDLAESLYMIAERYEWQRRFEEQKLIYREMLQRHAESPYASKAQIGIARSDTLSFIASQDYEQFEKAIDKLFINFTDNTDLPQTAIIVGEWFYKDGLSKRKSGFANEAKPLYEKALTVWSRFVNVLPDSNLAPEAYCWMGDCCFELGRYKEAIEYYKKSSDGYPQFATLSGIDTVHRWRSVYMTGQTFQKLKESSDINSTEADIAIIEAYERVTRDYKSCPVAKDTWRELGKLYAEGNNWQDTIRCFEAYLKLVPKERCPSEVFYELAKAYDKSENIVSAKIYYNLFIGSNVSNDHRRVECKNRVSEISMAN